MTLILFALLGLLILAELVKGLSANGTPPLLQKYSWQLDLAWTLWSSIGAIRIVVLLALILIAFLIPWTVLTAVGAIICLSLWGGIYWLFNRFWVGKYKFLPITQKVFAGAEDNQVDLNVQIIGVEHEGEKKAYPAAMMFYHHHMGDEIAGKPICVTYCGMCRSGRVYDNVVDGSALQFTLVGAITFNAILRDHVTGTWWRQETGEAVKGPLKGTQLADVPFEQMSLKNWLEKHPDSAVLQYDPTFQPKYNFLTKLLAYEASLPGWHRQETPPLILGAQIEGQARAYDWEQLKKRRLVMDTVGSRSLLVLSDAEGTSGFVYDRQVKGEVLDFELADGLIKDTKTGSTWTPLGRCIDGNLKGVELTQIQSYQQFLRAWVSFHNNTSFYEF